MWNHPPPLPPPPTHPPSIDILAEIPVLCVLARLPGLGFGAADEDEDEEIDGDGFGDDFGGADESEEEDTGFGDAADEDEDEGADAPAPAKAAPVEKKPEPPKHSFDTFAKEHFTSASTTYEHPGLHKAITEPLTNIVGPIDKAMAMALWEKLLVFMGDK